MIAISKSRRTNNSSIYNQGRPMTNVSGRGWMWAYRKMRSLLCPRLSSAYRATLYVLRGDTGVFYNTLTHQKIRIRK